MPELIQKAYEFVVQPVIWLLLVVAFVVFLWGVVEFIRSSGSEAGREKGKKHIIWGIIGLVIMASVLGITATISDTLGLEREDDPQQRLNLPR